jgi:Uma2 family endonuclease
MSHVHVGQPRRHRLTVADYYRMAEVGILAPDARVELIDGEIIDMAPPASSHAGTVDYLLEVLGLAARGKAKVRVQNPVRLSEYSEPQPDLALLWPREDFYRARHPRADDVLLIVEVAASSLRFDRKKKVPLYARHGVPEVWLASDSPPQAQPVAIRPPASQRIPARPANRTGRDRRKRPCTANSGRALR